jgi:multiple sugar transport system substrate-binding protein
VAGVAASRVFGAPAFAQTPASSPVASVPFSSTIAERASGQVRLSGSASPAEQEVINNQLATLMQHYPNIEVTFESIASDYIIKIQTDIAAGNAPDVFLVQNEYAPDFLSREVLLPIDDFVAEDAVNTGDFYQPLITAYTWQDQLYGLPKDWSPLGAIYDPAILDTIGEFPTEWDTLKTALGALRDANGGNPAMTLNPELARFILFLYQAGGNILNPEFTEITIGDDASLQALEFFNSLYTEKLIATSSEVGADWPGDAFIKGLSSIVFEGNWMFPGLAEGAPDKPFAVAELPAGPAGKGTPAFTQAFCISASTENPEAAWVVVNYLSSNEGAGLASTLGLAIPPRVDLEETYLSLFPERAPFLASGEYATAAQYGIGGVQFQTDATSELQKMQAGQQDVQTTMDAIVAYANSDITLAG